MRLHIGKNHEGNRSPVQSVFRLAGGGEDALTYALGYLLAYDPGFCAKVIRACGIRLPRAFRESYSVHLQEVTGAGYGRRDIVIQADGFRIVFEAKIGGAVPTPDQLLKYSEETEVWQQFTRRGIVALTKVGLPPTTANCVSSTLRKHKPAVRLYQLQWHQVVELALNHNPSDNSEVSRYTFREFERFIRSDFPMGYYDAEISIQDVNPCNAKIFKDGWLYVTATHDKSAPLYFAPYFTGRGGGINMLGRVMAVVPGVLSETKDIAEINNATEEHRQRWRDGLSKIRQRDDYPGFADGPTQLFYLDRPITIRTSPLSKTTFNKAEPPKKIPNQIPKGFSLRFDELLKVL